MPPSGPSDPTALVGATVGSATSQVGQILAPILAGGPALTSSPGASPVSGWIIGDANAAGGGHAGTPAAGTRSPVSSAPGSQSPQSPAGPASPSPSPSAIAFPVSPPNPSLDALALIEDLLAGTRILWSSGGFLLIFEPGALFGFVFHAGLLAVHGPFDLMPTARPAASDRGPLPGMPQIPPLELPSLASSGYSTFLFFTTFLALASMLSLMLAGWSARLRRTPARRPMPFVSLLERPG